MADTTASAPAPAPDNSRLPKTAKTGQTANAPASSHAAVSVVKAGGNSGGRKRADGLVPNSPEAAEADKKKDRERKQAARAVARQIIQPAPLPPAATPGAISSPPVESGIAPGVSTLAQPLAADGVTPAWTGSDLETTALLGLDVWESARRRNVEKKCEAAHLDPKLVKEISADARFNAAAKKAVSESGGEGVAYGLNTLGIPATMKFLPKLGAALALIVADGMKLDRRLDELIKAANPPAAQPGQTQKP